MVLVKESLLNYFFSLSLLCCGLLLLYALVILLVVCENMNMNISFEQQHLVGCGLGVYLDKISLIKVNFNIYQLLSFRNINLKYAVCLKKLLILCLNGHLLKFRNSTLKTGRSSLSVECILSMESQPQSPELRNNHENSHQCNHNNH